MTETPHLPGHRALRLGRISLPHQVYLITASTQGRQAFFRHAAAATAASRVFAEARTLGDASLLAWVLMPDHGHWLLQTGEQDALDVVVRRLKSLSAGAANPVLERSGPLWQKSYHDHALRTEEDLIDVARYVVANPLRAKLVTRLADYPFWGARWCPPPPGSPIDISIP